MVEADADEAVEPVAVDEQLVGGQGGLVADDVIGKDQEASRPGAEQLFPACEAGEFVSRGPVAPVLMAGGGELPAFDVDQPGSLVSRG
jgi:hypothetical protein